MKITCEIRPYLSRDLDKIKQIERQCFDEFRWDEADFSRFLGQMSNNSRKASHYVYVAEWREHVIGYMFLVEYATHVDIVNLGVAREFHRNGVASQMLDYVKQERLKPYGCEEALIYIKDDNKAAIQLVEKLGFYKAQKLKDYFPDNTSALKFAYMLPELPLDLTKVPVREGGLMV